MAIFDFDIDIDMRFPDNWYWSTFKIIHIDICVDKKGNFEIDVELLRKYWYCGALLDFLDVSTLLPNAKPFFMHHLEDKVIICLH